MKYKKVNIELIHLRSIEPHAIKALPVINEEKAIFKRIITSRIILTDFEKKIINYISISYNIYLNNLRNILLARHSSCTLGYTLISNCIT